MPNKNPESFMLQTVIFPKQNKKTQDGKLTN